MLCWLCICHYEFKDSINNIYIDGLNGSRRCKGCKKLLFFEFEDSINIIWIDYANWFRRCKHFCSFILLSYNLYFLKRDYCKKHRCAFVFVKLVMFQQADNKEQVISINDSSTAKNIFFLKIEIANFLAYWDFFAYICLIWCSEYEYLSYSMDFLFKGHKTSSLM